MTDVVPFQSGAMVTAEQAHLNVLWKQAQTLAQMNLLPADLKNNPASVFGVIMFGEQYGLSPAQAVSQLWIIKGRIVPSSQVYAGVAMRAGHEVRIEESSSERCVVAIKRRGTDYWQRVTWTIDDAKRAGLAGKEIWKLYPGDMLAHATMRRAVKRICADALLGIIDLTDDGIAVSELPQPPAIQPAVGEPERVVDIDLDEEPAADGAPEPAEEPKPVDAEKERRGRLQRGLMATATKAFPKDPALTPAEQRARATAQRHAIAYVALGEHKSANDMNAEELAKVTMWLDYVTQGRVQLEERDGVWVATMGDREVAVPAEAEAA